MNKIIRNTIGIMIVAGALLALPPTSAQAATLAANTQIVNSATLSYSDGGTTKTANATAIVLYAMVPSSPSVTPFLTPTPIPYVSGAYQENTFTLINNSNGKDSFNLTSGITAQTNTSGAISAVTAPASPVTLGATITSALGTTSRLIVPYDGSSGAGTGSINGLIVGKSISIGGATGYSITGVVNNASGSSYIDFTPAYGGGTPTNVPSGVQVGEYVTVTVRVTVNNISDNTKDVTVSKALTATSTTTPSATKTSDPMTDTFTSQSAQLFKYVRNLAPGKPGDASGATVTYGSDVYYQRGVPAAPNDKLEYVLVANNQGAIGSTPVSSARITDILPTSYVTYLTGQYNSGGGDIKYVDETNATSYRTGVYTGATSTLSVDVGYLPGNKIDPGKSVAVFYQVSINP